MKKSLFVLSAVAFSVSSAFACPTPTCASVPSPTTQIHATVTGNVNNSVAGYSSSSLGQSGASFAASTTTVTEEAGGVAGVTSNHNQAPNGTIYGASYTKGSVTTAGISASTGTGQAQTISAGYGSATSTVKAGLTSQSTGHGSQPNWHSNGHPNGNAYHTGGNASLNLNGVATSSNTVGIGYQTGSAGDGLAMGQASVSALSGSGFLATGTAQACNVPVNGKITDYKAGATITNAPVVNSFAVGNAGGGAFSPYTSGNTATAQQGASVVGSFAASK